MSSNSEALQIPLHPLGVKPGGNAYNATFDLRENAGYFSQCPDEMIVHFLEYLGAPELVAIGSTCKALYAFSRFEDLWKNLLIEHKYNAGNICWNGSWRNTYLNIAPSRSSAVSCDRIFSDVLYRPFYCSQITAEPYATSIPQENRIPLLHSLAPDMFSSDWADKPFILSSVVDRWPVYSSWSLDSLLQQYGDVSFTAEAVDWPMRLYAQYMAYNGDESPLYLFDRDFVRKMQLQIATPHATKRDSHAYWIPDCFGEDLFAVLGDKRPDCQWLIIGPARSGSTFHKDPNATSAWNAVLKGSKYWIMFPPSDRLPPPPGVLVSEDHSEVTSPLSIAEWLLGFHAQARATKGCKEGVCAAGEVLHVPSGWWHLVVNLETSIAITQNFVPAVHLPAAIRFLRDKPDQVSGFNTAEVEDPYKEFMQRLEQTHPSLLENALEMMNASSIGKKRRWDEVAGKSLDAGYADRGFSFGFSSDDDDETIDIP